MAPASTAAKIYMALDAVRFLLPGTRQNNGHEKKHQRRASIHFIEPRRIDLWISDQVCMPLIITPWSI